MKKLFYAFSILLAPAVSPLPQEPKLVILVIHEKTGMAISVPQDWSGAHGDDFISVQDPTMTTSATVQVLPLAKKMTAFAWLTKIERDYNDKRKNMLPAKARRLPPQRLKSLGVEDGCQDRYFFKEAVIGNRYEEYQVFTDSKKRLVYPEKLAAAGLEKIHTIMNSLQVKR